mmetsp:Transcript_23102/g.38008  ORF Transcript_23102/g.38008 Transcript_23102/m.38008 type:complete len:357 (+) Transcript_23102:147-1217(+)
MLARRVFLALFCVICIQHVCATCPARLPAPTKIATFKALEFDTPENLIVDKNNTIYVTSAFNGRIFKLSPLANGKYSSKVLTHFPLGSDCGYLTAVAGAALDPWGYLYYYVGSCVAGTSGLYRVNSATGAQTFLGAVPGAELLNGLVYYRNYIFATDSGLGRIVKLGPLTGPLSRFPVVSKVWADGPLLKPDLSVPYIGSFSSNGLRYYKGFFYVANTARQTILKIKLLNSGLAGPVQLYTRLPLVNDTRVPVPRYGVDDFAIDTLGRLYVTTNPFQTILRIDPDGTSKVVLSLKSNMLDAPTSAQFGRSGKGRMTLFVTNGGFPFPFYQFFPTPATHPAPSLIAIPLCAEGYFFN